MGMRIQGLREPMTNDIAKTVKPIYNTYKIEIFELH